MKKNETNKSNDSTTGLKMKPIYQLLFPAVLKIQQVFPFFKQKDGRNIHNEYSCITWVLIYPNDNFKISNDLGNTHPTKTIE